MSRKGSGIRMETVSLLVLLVVLLSLPFVDSRSPNPSAFGSCPPPRFDDFSEKLVVKWGYLSPSSEGTITALGTVEEVMRSCGGAVQGIREVPPIGISVEEDEGLYLNRANDGFVFHDNGSYSLGPVEWNKRDLFLTSLMFEKNRVVVWADIAKETGDNIFFETPQSMLVKRSSDDSALHSVKLVNDPQSLSTNFGIKIRCSMPSPGQPWMLQRVRWEREVTQVEVENVDQKTTFEEAFGCWFVAQSAAEYNQSTGNSESILSKGTVISTGVVCKQTGLVKSFVRHYNPQEQLESVTLLEGKISN
jgi:hypothetical protein